MGLFNGRPYYFVPIVHLNHVLMKKIVLTYGLISGGIAAALMFAMALYMGNDPANFENGEIFGYASIILSMLLVFLGVRAYREQVGGGRLTFGQGFQVGILITIISCICYVLAWQVVYRTLMPDFMEQFVDLTLNKMKKDDASAAAIAEKTAEMENFREMYKNPLFNMAITFLEPFPIGLAVTLATAGILRKK